ncbi:hypothetical protein P879_03989 [Paragonimus westermani]|uniref:Uncharacterized protein n=1 Tax=Paragonimus westermani TaxID=34504 RepID=A0A8T0DY80_9TREM|nr:hypothetical protein P879_03989 [Paragonimus westermani]
MSLAFQLEFISHDIGEPDIEKNPEWQEDIVPDSCRIDSWAQGAISKRCAIASLSGEGGKDLTLPKQRPDDRLADNEE